MKLQPYLDRMGIHYQMRRHDTAFTAQDLARKEHVSGHQVIKPVLVQVDGQFVLCALPASARVDLLELRKELGAEEMKLADERTLEQVFENCEVGAEPPIGAIFGLPTVMDDSLTDMEQVTFQAGTHADAVTIAMADYQRIAQPGIAHFARPFA
jgi:Ala-tRNA(Pro) deacylase